MAADRVVLSVTVHDAGRQTADGQFVELSESGGVRLRPWSIRYHTPAELDAMAVDAGFELEHRWEVVRASAVRPRLHSTRQRLSENADRRRPVGAFGGL